MSKMDNSRYLFRGKRLDSGAWEIGHYVPVIYEETWNGQDDHENITVKHVITNGFTQEVIQIETLGQSTGLYAAKSYRGESEADRLIWEGDLIASKSYSLNAGRVIYHDGIFGIEGGYWSPEPVAFYKDANSGICRLEIIGTIHDKEACK